MKSWYMQTCGYIRLCYIFTEKLLYIGCKVKYCPNCKLDGDQKPHECFKNWDKSSRAMETEILLEGFMSAE